MKKPLLLFLLTYCFRVQAQNADYKSFADSFQILQVQCRKALAYTDSIKEGGRAYKHTIGPEVAALEASSARVKLDVQTQSDTYLKAHSEYRKRYTKYLPVPSPTKPYTTRSISPIAR